LDISCGYTYLIIHEDVGYHRICARWVPKQLTYEHKWVCNFCSYILRKDKLSCNGLSQAIKHRFTIMNLQANVTVWNGNTHHRPGRKISSVPSPNKVILTLLWNFNGSILEHCRDRG
jgi:hypothetical protein